MADNVVADPGAGGATFATDDIGGVHYPRTKVAWGADGFAADVSAADPLPVTAASLPLPTGAATSALQTTGNTSLATLAGAVAGTEVQVDVVAALPAGANTVGNVGIIQGGNVASVDTAGVDNESNTSARLNTRAYLSVFDGTTWDRMRGDSADGVLVNLGANNDVTVTGSVDATNAAFDVVGGGVEAAALRVTLASDSTGVLSVDDNGGSLTVDGTVAATQSGAWVLGANSGVDIGDVTINNAAGAAAVNIQDGGNSITVDGSVSISGSVDTELPTAAAASDNFANPTTTNIMGMNMLWDGAAWDRAPGNSTDGTLVNLGVHNDVTVTNATAANLLANVGGLAAHDAAASGNPLTVAATHETIADSAPTNRLATVTDGDVTRMSATDGAVFVIPSGPQQWKARLTGTMTDTTVKTAPGAGLSLYIQTIVYSIGAATASSIMLEESTTTPVCGPHYLEAVNGRGIALNFNPPIKITANTLLSATNTGSTTATLDVYGFTAPG